MDFDKFLLFGDSITQFSSGRCETVEQAADIDEFSLGSGLGAVYNRKLDVVVRGFSGYNTRWGLPILEAILAAERESRSKNHQGRIVMSTVFFGSNDSVSSGPQRVPLDEFGKNVRCMITKLQELDIKPVLVTPARVEPNQWAENFQQDKENGYIRSDVFYKEYRDQLLKLGEEFNVPVVDLYAAFASENVSELLTDGVHFTGKGYRVFFKALMDTIAKHYPEMTPQALPFHLPYWRDVTEDETSVLVALNRDY
ncbi:Isoamyl acetate-hydrolyzing esterase [Nakaseomyces bracarensis]|uniref:Isoamyl acetate-hydrolyzing esterase n=1 Tax=Nakaseomyces bracarensis TaxID=273131 RepID=A0ABR4NUB0_9SACH